MFKFIWMKESFGMSDQSLVVEHGRVVTMSVKMFMQKGEYIKLYLNQHLKDSISEIRNTVNLGDITICVNTMLELFLFITCL